MFTLYSYDHCPYCMRARMIFGFHDIAYEHKILPNDDEQTPIDLIGQKMVPILIKENGDAMPESMDIIDYIDLYAQNKKSQPALNRQVRPEVKSWQDNVADYYYHLTMPRAIIVCKEDFPTQSAVDYFQTKKTNSIGDFASNMANSAEYIHKANEDLQVLATLMQHKDSLNGEPSMEDILVFPTLRSLSMVKGIQWPQKVKDYVEQMAKITAMPLFFDQAV